LIKAMLAKLETQPSYNHRVTSVDMTTSVSSPDLSFPLTRVSVSGKQDGYFTHVVSTASFANLRTINTDRVPMTYKQRQAIRALNYGPAVKVAIKFRTRWWEQGNMKQLGGASYMDRQSRVVVYPSYGLGEEGPGVLMVTYNWCAGLHYLCGYTER
jgi:monoamine oxidase